MNECPVCSKDIPVGERIKVTAEGGCSVCGLDLVADAQVTEFEQTTEERARIAEVKRLHRIASGARPQTVQMNRAKGLLALLIIVCILVYTYTWDRQRKEAKQANRIEVSYRSFNVLFGPGSRLADSEKLEEFKHWRMSPVSWKGKITYLNLGAEPDLYVTVSHASRLPSSDVLIRFEEVWRDRLSELKVGQYLRYSGRISEFDRGTSFITLKRGSIIGEPQ